MKKVLYLHGLESKQGGEKVDLLSRHFTVHAPSIDYTDPDVYESLHRKTIQMSPDLIIGSSMGGYFATLLVMNSFKPAEVLLFNPAIHSRTFEPTLPETLRYKDYVRDETDHLVKGRIIVGLHDQLVPSDRTRYMTEHNERLDFEFLTGVFHRIPYEQFELALQYHGYIE